MPPEALIIEEEVESLEEDWVEISLADADGVTECLWDMSYEGLTSE